MGADSPPLPLPRREPLLRGPLILTAVSRVLMIPFYFLCAFGESANLKILFRRLTYYRGSYVVDKVALVATLWAFGLLSVLLAWLFFSRHRMFRSLMVYFSILLPLLFVAVGIHTSHFKFPGHSQPHEDPSLVWIGFGMILAMMIWPFYYGFSPRVKRVFTR